MHACTRTYKVYYPRRRERLKFILLVPSRSLALPVGRDPRGEGSIGNKVFLRRPSSRGGSDVRARRYSSREFIAAP